MIVDNKALAEALTPLPETADELRAVGDDLGAKPEDIELGEAATVTNVKRARLDDYRIVYFATHALVAGEVEKIRKSKSGASTRLSIPDKPTEEDDGLLRASDVAMLKMDADFVVLSACNMRQETSLVPKRYQGGASFSMRERDRCSYRMGGR